MSLKNISPLTIEKYVKVTHYYSGAYDFAHERWYDRRWTVKFVSRSNAFDIYTWVLHLMFQTGRGKSYRIIYLELLMRTTRFSLELLAGDNRNKPTYKWYWLCFTVYLYNAHSYNLQIYVRYIIWVSGTYLTSNWDCKIQMFQVGFPPHYRFWSLKVLYKDIWL